VAGEPIRPALPAPQAVSDIIGPLDAEQAAMIGQALPGAAEDAIADGKP
jgi:hypothetical protein